MVDEPEFLRKAAIKTAETNDRYSFARVMVNSTHVRNFVWLLARHANPDETQTPDRTDLGVILRRIANRIRDIDDPALDRLSEADDVDRFQHALGAFLRDTVRQVLAPPPPALGSSVAGEIASMLLAAGLAGEVAVHIAMINASAHTCVASLTSR